MWFSYVAINTNGPRYYYLKPNITPRQKISVPKNQNKAKKIEIF